MRALILGLLAAILGGDVGARPSDAKLQAWMAEPEANLSKLGVTYWRVEEAWADRDAVVTIDDSTIAYSAACNGADFSYTQDWDPPASVLEVFQGGLAIRRCGQMPSTAFLRFYYFLSQSDLARGNESSLAIGLYSLVKPFIRLRRFEPVGLEFRRWIIAEYFDGARLITPNLSYPDAEHPQAPPDTAPPPVITFDRGDLEGSPSCGALFGDYTLAGRSLRLHASFSLRGFCPPTALLQNDRVLAALRRARRFDRNGAGMILRGAKGEVEVVLAPA